MGISCAPGAADDPAYKVVPWYGFYGTIKTAVVGRTRGYDKMNVTCINGSGPIDIWENYSWGKYERLTMTVKTAGIEGTPAAFGPWEVKLGIPVPR